MSRIEILGGCGSLQGRSGRVTLPRTKVVVMGWTWRGREDMGRRAERVMEGRRIALHIVMVGLTATLIDHTCAGLRKLE